MVGRDGLSKLVRDGNVGSVAFTAEKPASLFPQGQGPTIDLGHTESGLMVYTARIAARATNGNVDGYIDKQNTQVYNTHREQNGWTLGGSDISRISTNEWHVGQSNNV